MLLTLVLLAQPPAQPPALPPTLPPRPPPPLPPPPFNLTILATQAVRGSAFPVSWWGSECSASAYNETPCNCYGGAPRRHAFLAGARSDPNTVALDMGSYFFGSGLFFPTFAGNASIDFLSSAGYEAFGLGYRDLSAFAHGSADPAGTARLAAYLARVRAADPSLPLATASNLDLSGMPLEAHVAPYTILPLGANRSMALISLLDRTDLAAVNPTLGARVVGFRRALHTALLELRRRPAGMPEVVVLTIEGAHRLHFDFGGVSDGLTTSEGSWHTIEQLAKEADGVDVVLCTSVTLPHSDWPRVVQTWGGGHVLVVPDLPTLYKAHSHASGGSGQKDALTLTAQFTHDGRLVPNASHAVVTPLDCHAAEDAERREALFGWHAQMTALMARVQGHLAATARSYFHVVHDIEAGQCTTLPAGSACGCYLAECAAGNLVADGVRWKAEADVALINGGGIRDDLPAGAVERRHLLQALPFLNEVMRLDVSGATLLAQLAHGLSNLGSPDAIANPAGRFPQLSGLRMEWRFEDSVVKVVHAELTRPNATAPGGVTRVPIDPAATYSLATNSYLAGGGDGYALVGAGVQPIGLGLTLADALGEYLAAEAPTAATPLNVTDDMAPTRIVQLPARAVLRVALLCATDAQNLPVGREWCDHAWHMARAINDKSDGYLDDLLPHALLELNETNVGCNGGNRPLGALASMLAWEPQLLATVGPFCSADVVTIANTSARATLNGHDAVVISPASTADEISDTALFPHVVRLSAPEVQVSQALAAVVRQYGWRRVALLHDDSVWGASSGGAFRDAFLADHAAAGDGDGEARQLLTTWGDGGATGAVVSHASCQATRGADGVTTAASAAALRATATELLDRLEAVNARVIVTAMNPECQQIVYEAAHEQQRLVSKGHAWLSTWVDEAALHKDGAPSAAAIQGAIGTIGVRAKIADPAAAAAAAAAGSSSGHARYMELWQAASTANDALPNRGAACGADPTRDADGARAPPFCDTDNDATTFGSASYLHATADSVLALAHAMHVVLGSGGSSVADRSHDSAALYAALLALPAGLDGMSLALPDGLHGLSGTVRFGADGDRIGSFEVVNLQLVGTSATDAATATAATTTTNTTAPGRRLMVSLETRYANFVPIATYDASAGLSFDASRAMLFHGPSYEVPADWVQPPACGGAGVDASEYWGVNFTASCSADDGHHALSFFWRVPPPFDGCVLPTDEAVECTFEPRGSSTALVLGCVGLGVPFLGLLLLTPFWWSHRARIVSCALGRVEDEFVPEWLPRREWLPEASGLAGWVRRVLACCCTVGGIGALCASPLVLAGAHERDACAARLALQSLAPALTAYGIATATPLYARLTPQGHHGGSAAAAEGGYEASAAARAAAQRRHSMKTAALHAAATLALVALVPCASVWARDAALEEFEVAVPVASDGRGVVVVNATRCALEAIPGGPSTSEATTAAMLLATLLLFACILLHCVCLWVTPPAAFAERQASLVALLGCCIFGCTFFMSARGSMGVATDTAHRSYGRWASVCTSLGLCAFASECLVPTAVRWREQSREKGQKLLYLDNSSKQRGTEVDVAHEYARRGGPFSGESHIFLSHRWSSGQDQVHNMKELLQGMCPRLVCWLDTDNIESMHKLQEAVEQSDVLLVFLSRHYLASEYCRLELEAAWRAGKPILLVRESSVDHGAVQSSLQLLDVADDKVDDALAEYCVGAGGARPELRAAMAWVREMVDTNDADEVLWWYRLRPFKKEVLKLVVARILSEPWRAEHKRRRALTPEQRKLEAEERAKAEEATEQQQLASLEEKSSESFGRSSAHHSSVSGGATEPALLQIGFQEDLKARKPDTDIQLYVSEHYPAALRTKLRGTFATCRGVKLTPHNRQGAVPVLVLYDHTEEGVLDSEPRSFFHSRQLVALACALVPDDETSGQVRLTPRLKKMPSPRNKKRSIFDGAYVETHERPSIFGRRPSFDDDDADTISCVHLYSCRQGFVAYKEAGQLWASVGDTQAIPWRKEMMRRLFSVLWSQWPRDRTLQQVAGKMAVAQLLAQKRSGELRPMTEQFLQKLERLEKKKQLILLEYSARADCGDPSGLSLSSPQFYPAELTA